MRIVHQRPILSPLAELEYSGRLLQKQGRGAMPIHLGSFVSLKKASVACKSHTIPYTLHR